MATAGVTIAGAGDKARVTEPRALQNRAREQAVFSAFCHRLLGTYNEYA
jgi:hypothetical protein